MSYVLAINTRQYVLIYENKVEVKNIISSIVGFPPLDLFLTYIKIYSFKVCSL